MSKPSERDNLEPFRNPNCSCEWWENKEGVTVSWMCSIHGVGTDYWNGMTDEMKRGGIR